MARMYVNRPNSSFGPSRVQTNKQEDGTNMPVWAAGTEPSGAQTKGSNWHEFRNDGKTLLQVETGSDTSQKMIVVSQASHFGLDLENREIDLAASETHIFGPFPPAAHNYQTGIDKGYTSVYFTGTVTDLMVTAYSI